MCDVCVIASCVKCLSLCHVVCLSCASLAVQMLGRCMFTVTCTESMTLPMMLQYMMGMVQSGCWMLFDDTDRLTKGMPPTHQHTHTLYTCPHASSKALVWGHKLGHLTVFRLRSDKWIRVYLWRADLCEEYFCASLIFFLFFFFFFQYLKFKVCIISIIIVIITRPQDLRHCSTLSSFEAKLKTFLFSQYFHPS